MIEQVQAYVAENRDRFISELQEFCRIPSLSASDQQMDEGAAFVRKMLKERGVSSKILETPRHPAVFGEIKGSTNRALLLYAHYDVQAPEPLEEWIADPFEARIIDGKIYARGVSDHKSSVVARIHGLETFLAVMGELPVTLKFIIEGEEEIGSPSLEGLLRENRELLKADAALYSGGRKDERDRPRVVCGSKGMCYVELISRGAVSDVHSREAPLVPSPVWRLIWALSTLKDPETDRVLIDGFYDDVESPTSDDIEAVKAMDFDSDAYGQALGLDRLLGGREGWEAALHQMFSPTCTVAGLTAGYQGPGSKTVLPNRASAKIDFRLVVQQCPQDILAKLRSHLDRHGFEDIEVVSHNFLEADRTPLNHPLVEVIRRAAERTYDEPVILQPTAAGSGPRYLFRRILGLPMVSDCGSAYQGGTHHAPNENIRVSDYLDNVQHMAHVYDLFAQSGIGARS